MPEKTRRILSVTSGILGILLLGIVILLASLLSIPKMPAPSGSFEVGTTYFHLIDKDRPEMATADTSDLRSLWVQAWYPAEHTRTSKRMPVLPESERYMEGLLQNLGLPTWVPQHWDLIVSHSYLDAPVKTNQKLFPVILFSHAHSGFLSHNTQQFEALASHGFVVFSIAHSYNTMLGLRQDGSWLTLEDTNSVVFSRIDTAIFNPAARASRRIRSEVKSPVNLTPTHRKMLDSLNQIMYGQYHDQLAVRAADLSFVLNQIERMQSGDMNSIFKGKLNTAQVGSFGGSLGGASAVLFSATDPRCLASANIDGSQFGIMYQFSLNKPHLVFFNGRSEGDNGFLLTDWENVQNAKPYYKISIEGAGHGNIIDMVGNPILARNLGLGVGSIDPELVYDIYNEYLLAFFNEHVKSEKQPLLERESTFPEVEIKKY